MIDDDKNSLFRVERRAFPNCVSMSCVPQDVAGPQIESRPASSRPLFKYVWPITDNLSIVFRLHDLPEFQEF